MANEKRLIWDEDAKRRLIALAVGHHTETLPIDMILNAILHNTPTVDAVEVVRCKDCEKGHSELAPNGGVWCEKWNHVFGDDGYCSYGERKT